ncbi:MAG: glycosyltransferase, partial [Patescibacteria group bacterium]
MKIVLINNLFGEYARGGAEHVVAAIADGLTQFGHEVVVVGTRPVKKSIKSKACLVGRQVHKVESQDARYSLLVTRYFFYPWNIISYYNLYKLPTVLRLVWHLINIFNIQSYFKIKKILQTEKPDLVITHNLMGVGFLTPLAIKHYGVKAASVGLRRAKHIHTL